MLYFSFLLQSVSRWMAPWTQWTVLWLNYPLTAWIPQIMQRYASSVCCYYACSLCDNNNRPNAVVHMFSIYKYHQIRVSL